MLSTERDMCIDEEEEDGGGGTECITVYGGHTPCLSKSSCLTLPKENIIYYNPEF